ncbi:MAG: ATP-binding protein [Caldilineaceae bacterium]
MPTLYVERVPLELVLRNLVSNAIKHHHRNDGHIQIAAQMHDHDVEFIVRDDGPGIDPQHHERIFGMFEKLRSHDEVEGSGMGLAVVRRTVESRGGQVSVESAVGAGATFRFTWPQSET